HTGPTRHLGPALGCERRRLLVPRVDEPDAGLHATVVEREEVTARQSEDGVDVVAAQRLGGESPAIRLQLLAHAAGARSTGARKCWSTSSHADGFSSCGE